VGFLQGMGDEVVTPVDESSLMLMTFQVGRNKKHNGKQESMLRKTKKKQSRIISRKRSITTTW